jgi:hypothetical protein
MCRYCMGAHHGHAWNTHHGHAWVLIMVMHGILIMVICERVHVTAWVLIMVMHGVLIMIICEKVHVTAWSVHGTAWKGTWYCIMEGPMLHDGMIVKMVLHCWLLITVIG